MKIAKKLLALALTAALLVTPCFAAVNQQTVTVGSKSAKLVTTTIGAGAKVTVTFGQGSINKDMPFADHIAAATAELGIAPTISVNGGYFNSYYKGTPTFPNNCAHTYAMVIKDGEVVTGGGASCMPTLGFTEDGRAIIDKVVTKPYAMINGSRYEFWGVNVWYDDAGALMVFTPEVGYSIPLPSDSTALYVRNGSVERVQNGGVADVTAGYKLIVFQSAFWASATQWNNIGTGSSVEFGTEFTPTYSSASDWEKVTTAVSAGPWLLANGAVVTTQNPEYPEAKQQPDYVAGRTFVGVLADGSLAVCTGTASPNQAAAYLQSLGAVNGMCLDGGASSALAVNGTVVTPAGRLLSNVLHIASAESLRAVNSPSDWAEASVNEAVGKNLVPKALQTKYTASITRAEFCSLVSSYINTLSGKSSILANAKEVSFTDTADADVLLCASLGIVNGIGDGLFSPSGLITREQAAKMLRITAELSGKKADGEALTFADSASFSDWAVEGIDYCTRAGILNGEGSNFNPTGNFTREQAIITMLRMTK